MPTQRTLTLSCTPYDHTAALLDGTITIDGYALHAEPSTDISRLFERVVRNREFDVAELGFTFFVRSMDLANPPFYALPVFLIRKFQHSTTFINVGSGITTPADLGGKTIGEFAIYGHDMGVWPKGIFSDYYGFAPANSHWIVGGVTKPMSPMDFVPLRHPADVSVDIVPEGKTLGSMLERSEIGALISAVPPEGIINGSAHVRHLFPDHEAVEAAYYTETGIFPIMHIAVVKRRLIDDNPGLARALLTAFNDAKTTAIARYRSGGTALQASPWFAQLLDKDSNVVDDDRWDYGVRANRNAVDTFLRYHFEQGLSERHMTSDDIFPAELLDT